MSPFGLVHLLATDSTWEAVLKNRKSGAPLRVLGIHMHQLQKTFVQLLDEIYKVAADAFAKKTNHSSDWFKKTKAFTLYNFDQLCETLSSFHGVIEG